MLQTLDPHSSFMSPRDYARIRERQEGRYYGLGIQILVTDGDITVSTVFEGSPAYQKGLRTGDVIARIESENTKGWTSDQAVGKLRGQRGTTVRISVRRYGYDALIDMDVLRDEIHIPSIPLHSWSTRQRGTFAFRISQRTRIATWGSAQDPLGQGHETITARRAKQPGGPLDQAIRVSNRFLPRGELIVYTRGRVPNSDQDYRATENSEYTDLPVVVLTNRNSAVPPRLCPAPCRTTIARSSWVRPRSARRSCNRSIA